MKPIFFPFTYISKPVAEALFSCFGKSIIYQPSAVDVPEKMNQWTESGMLDIRIPVKNDEQKLSTILKEYKIWANLHQERMGDKFKFFNAQRNKVPFFDDTSSSQIKADIKDFINKNRSSKNQDSIFNARVFLSIAQDFDIQNDTIIKEMVSFETAQQDLIKKMKGDNETSYAGSAGKEVLKTDYSGDYMIPERLKAWALLMCCDPWHNKGKIPGFFITSSRPVIDYLIDKIPGAESVLRIDEIPVSKDMTEEMVRWREGLISYLEILADDSRSMLPGDIAKVPADQKCGRKISLTLYLVPGVTLREFLTSFIKFDSPCGEIEKNKVGFKNTIFGHIGV